VTAEPFPVAHKMDDDEEDEEQPPVAPELNQEDEDADLDGVDEEDDEEETDFAEICSRIRNNDRNFTEYVTPLVISDDDIASLSSALYFNTNLKSLNVIMGRIASLTSHGAQMLGNAIQRSKIESVTLHFFESPEAEAPPNVATLFFQMASETVERIHLIFRLSETDAIQIEEALVRTRNTDSLKSLCFHVPSLTPTTAKSLAQGSKALRLHQSE
jgi:hypothetical protein